MRNLFFWSRIREQIQPRLLLLLAGDVSSVTLAVFFAFLLRFDGRVPPAYLDGGMQAAILLILVFSLPLFLILRIYSISWIHPGVIDLVSLGKAIGLSTLFTGSLFLLLQGLTPFEGFPRSVLLLSFILFSGFAVLTRFAGRAWSELFHGRNGMGERVLIVGAGDAGAQVARELHASFEYEVVGFVDDDLSKQKDTVYGLRVLGLLSDIPRVIPKERVESVIIALPSAGSRPIRQAVQWSRQAGVTKIKIVPSLAEFLRGSFSLGDIREVQVEDLLGREPFELDTTAIEASLAGKRILITGAAGSIGSELARQVAKFQPSRLLLLDKDETGLFFLDRELKKKYPALSLVPLVGDIQDRTRMQDIFRKECPQTVFHAAAYKHVPMMEEHPQEAVKNNVFGLQSVAEAALAFGTEYVVFISTDKAVNPTSIMGTTKRIGEMICQVLNKQNRTRFLSVRFGNVLNSRGSVIPIFKEQIANRGPVEVTHPDMRRYFMLTSEACLLVMQAGAMGKGGEVFVLDMGTQVKIVDLAHELIRLSGFEPDKDIPVVFTGVRPGEKLFEDVLTAEEDVMPTSHQKVLRVLLEPTDEAVLQKALDQLRVAVETSNTEEVRHILASLVRQYTP